MRRACLLLLCGIFACGSRTELDAEVVSDAGVRDDVTRVQLPDCRDKPWLVFTLSRGNSSNLYAMRVDGTDGHLLRLPNEGSFPSFSTDGTKLFYISSTEEDDDAGYLNALVVQTLATSATEQLATSLVQNDVEEETAALTYSALSPDGQTVAYTLGYGVRLVNIDGTNDRPLIGSADGTPVYGHPSFTIDSGTVLYGSGDGFGSVAVGGTDDQTLVTQDGEGGPEFPNPTISPDGESVAAVISCAGTDAGTGETTLRVYPLASLPASCVSGVVVTTLSDNFSSYNGSANPSWGPTGLIAYGSESDVWAVDPSGDGAPRNLTAKLHGKMGAAFDPIWAPGCAPIP